jgi:hypothetical protein
MGAIILDTAYISWLKGMKTTTMEMPVRGAMPCARLCTKWCIGFILNSAL